MNCPVCKRRMGKQWEEKHRDWWYGLWNCSECGNIRMSGDFHGRIPWTRARVLHWVPACHKCGHDNVTALDKEYSAFVCWSCSRRMEVRNGKIVTTWQPLQINLTSKEKTVYVVSTQN